MKKLIVLAVLLISINVLGQKIPVTDKDYSNQEVEMADTMRSEGKIYVVVAIVGVIMIGLLGYAMTIDRKISKLEKEHGID